MENSAIKRRDNQKISQEAATFKQNNCLIRNKNGMRYKTTNRLYGHWRPVNDTQGYRDPISDKIGKQSNAAKESTSGYVISEAVSGGVEAGRAALRNWVPNQQKEHVHAEVAVASAEEKFWEHGGVEATADFVKAEAGTLVIPGVMVEAKAAAKVAEATAKASLVDGIIEVNAGASLCKAKATAGVDVFGARAEADASVGSANAGIANTPLQVSAKAATANAKAGVSVDYFGGEIGGSLAEAKAGPFAVRVGLKVGAHVENGVPALDLGPISVPCTIM